MRVFALSDVHVDFAENMTWILGLSNDDYQDDVLILAGDVSDLLPQIETVLVAMERKFTEVFYVPGNHELWVARCETANSLEKFELIAHMARESGARTEVWSDASLTIVPLLSWYDFSFGEPDEGLKDAWMDFLVCVWPDHYAIQDVNKHFLDQNPESLSEDRDFVVSFSHFLPRIDLMPDWVPLAHRFVYPVLGSAALGQQVAALRPNVHVYGHSHVNRRVTLDQIEYVNNAFGYPSEARITRKRLTCVYDSGRAADHDGIPA